MSTTLELKQRVRELEARVRDFEERLKASGIDSSEVVRIVEERIQELLKREKAEVKPKVGLCPHCNVKPAYFFHVRSCLKKNKNNDDRNRDPGGT